MPQAELLHEDAGFQLLTIGSLFFITWIGETSLERIQILDQRFGLFLAGQPSKIGLITVVTEGAPLPGHQERKALADSLQRGARKVAASGLVFKGSGFRAAAVRSVVTSITRLMPPPFPHVVYKSLSSALDEILPALAREGGPEYDRRTVLRHAATLAGDRNLD